MGSAVASRAIVERRAVSDVRMDSMAWSAGISVAVRVDSSVIRSPVNASHSVPLDGLEPLVINVWKIHFLHLGVHCLFQCVDEFHLTQNTFPLPC